MKIKYFSTFTGVGGFEIGITRAIPNSKCVGMSEIDKHASNVLRKQFKEVKNYGDIKNIKAEQLPDFDILCGGFPCQSFSIAGKRMGFEDTRGTLFYELARIAKSKKPSILFFENVKGLLSHEEGRTITAILKALDELGYDSEWQLLNSKDFGVPQNRERIIIVGHLRGKPRLQVFPIRRATSRSTEQSKREEVVHGALTVGLGRQGSSSEAGLYQIKEKLEAGKPRWGDHYKTSEDISPTLMAIGKTDVTNIIVHSLQTRNKNRPSLKKNPKAGGSGHISKTDETYCLDTGSTQAIEIPVVFDRGKIRETKQSTCIDANYHKGADQHGARTHVKKGTTIRRLTPIECERLQGFPDNWTKYGMNEEGETIEISDSQRYKMMGNAVTTNVMEAVAERIKLALRHRMEKK